MIKDYYHVSSFLGTDDSPIIIRGKKPLQNYIDFCLRFVESSSFKSFKYGFDLLTHPFIELNRTRRDVFKWMTEIVFEMVRTDKYPQMPSRMNGLFLCSSLENAKIFNNTLREGKARIYRCNLDESNVFSFNMDIFTKADSEFRNVYSNKELDLNCYDKLVRKAEEYWKSYPYNGKRQELICELDELHLEFILS